MLLSEYPIPELEAEEKSPINPRICVRSDPYHGFCWGSREMFRYIYDGARDEDDMFHGEGSVTFDDGGEITGSWCRGARSGKCSITNHDGTMRIQGTFKNGKLCGKGRVVRENFTVDGYFRDGCLHGLSTIEDVTGSLFVGRFTNGHPEGRWWQFIKAGGFVLGDLEFSEAGVSIRNQFLCTVCTLCTCAGQCRGRGLCVCVSRLCHRPGGGVQGLSPGQGEDSLSDGG